MKILYWNTNKITSLTQIIDICNSEKPDLFFLSEIDQSIITAYDSLLLSNGYLQYANPGCQRVKIIAKNALKITLGIQNRYYTHIILSEYNLNVISLHLPSQMFQHMDALKEFIRDFRSDIDNYIGSSINENIIVIGDFNVNPFEKPMIDFDGFSATNTLKFRKSITQLGKKKALYYNPTWKLYANNQFPGTKYFPRPSGASYDILEHHFLDQVVISSRLLNEIASEDIKIINKTLSFTFNATGSNIITESDHLPLSYEIKF